MSDLVTVIDFGSKNLRLGVFDQSCKNIYSSNLIINEVLKHNGHEQSLNKLIRDAEKSLSTHLVDVNVMYDTSRFNFIDLSIKKSFDQLNSLKLNYDNLLKEANFIISENNYKDQIIHVAVSKVIIDNNRIVESISDDIKIKSIILEIKYICLNKTLMNDTLNIFKKNNLNVSNLYCSSYVKSIFYKKDFKIKKDLIFLDIGFERTSALFFYNNKFQFFNSLPIGSNNITKDISTVLKLDLDYSEDLKLRFNQGENTISSDRDYSANINLFSEINKKKISINLLKKIIEARVNEIIELTVTKNNYYKRVNTLEKPCLIFTGKGSKLLPNIFNIYLKEAFSELIFFEENETKICDAGINYHVSDQRFLTNIRKKHIKKGFFVKFFNLFSK